MNKKTEVAITEKKNTFNLPIFQNAAEANSVIHANMDGMGNFRFEKIKMPAGGGIAFEMQDENGEPMPVREIRGVILDKLPFRAWYEKSFDEKNADDIGTPNCHSEDGVKGTGYKDNAGRVVVPEGQLCENCPKGQWGSSRKGGRGKDCNDKIRIHILLEGEAFPKYIDAPPTTLANFKQYIHLLSNKIKPFYGVVTSLKLEKAKSDGGIDYSKIVFSKGAELTADERAAVKELIQTLLPAMRKITKDSIGDPPGTTQAASAALPFDNDGFPDDEPY